VPHRRRPLHGNVSTASSSRSVHRPERCRVRELPDCTHDPTPDRNARGIPILPEFVGPPCALHLSLIAVALKDQIGNAPVSISGIMPERLPVEPSISG
jgi:hypothetical protein